MTDFRGAEMQALEAHDRLAAKDAEITRLKAELAEVNKDRDGWKYSSCSLESSLRQVDDELAELKAENANRVSYTALQASLSETLTKLKDAEAELAEERKIIKIITRDNLKTKRDLSAALASPAEKATI